MHVPNISNFVNCIQRMKWGFKGESFGTKTQKNARNYELHSEICNLDLVVIAFIVRCILS